MVPTRPARTASLRVPVLFALRVATCYAADGWTWKSPSASIERQCSANVAPPRRLCPLAPRRQYWPLARLQHCLVALAAVAFTPPPSVGSEACGLNVRTCWNLLERLVKLSSPCLSTLVPP